MTDLEMHFSALDRCRTAISKATSHYRETLTENNPGEVTYEEDGRVRNNRTPISASAFGDLEGSAALAGCANGVWSTLLDEMDQARRKLRDTEAGLSNVETNITKAHRATS
ncbi:hypothetical protein ACBI99_12275 [Nonomuraea sp. ATR24]|uniref:hypothetical protein n=1 Tax=Nonomuraea TaxID=83681 RepID=UPI001C5DEBB8|nr:hypothetical protein [Nonomuraea ceibae]